MMRQEKFAIADIYVPIKRRPTLKPETVQKIAQSMLEVGQQAPILVRRGGGRFVLVTVCIASKHAGHWAKRRSMDASSRPRSTKTTVCGVKVAQDPQGLTFTVARAGRHPDPYKHQPCRSAGTRSFAHGTASFAKSTSMAGHTGVCVDSQLTLRADYLMKTNQCRGEERYWDSSS